jgi:hypothetical protein
MPGTVIGKSLGLGYAGKVSRNPFNKINSRMVKSILNGSGVETLSVIPFGAAVVVNTDNTYSKFGDSGSGVSAATMANFGGIAVSEVRQGMTYAYGSNSSAGQFETNKPVDVLQIGTTTVFCKSGTPLTNGQVGIVTVAGTALAVGDLTAEAAGTATDGATVIAVTGAKFTSNKQDASGIVEITLTQQLNA